MGKRWDIEDDFRALSADGEERASLLLERLRRRRALEEESGLPFSEVGSAPSAMHQAVERTLRAVSNREKIALFGDFDCDGITAVCQLQRALRRRGAEPVVRLPQRVIDGYGIRIKHVEEFAGAGVSLLFLLDTGIVAHAEIAAAVRAGMDVIVLDHHRLPSELPPAFAIIHPELASRPGASLAAAGVVFGFVSALEGWKDWPGKEEDIALAAIGTVADLVPLKGSNRTLVRVGIEALQTLDSGPLSALCKTAGIARRMTSRDIAFRIAPRLNAAGRMADPVIALRALQGDGDALILLENFNTLRQDSVRTILSKVRVTAGEKAFLCLASKEYPAGVVGLVAGKLTETYGRPSLVAHMHGDICTASLRSVFGYDVTEALRSCSDLLLTFGGHSGAAGCTFRASVFEDLATRLDAHARSLLSSEDLVPTLAIDGVLDPDHISLSLCNTIGALEPFGEGNREPRFLIPSVQLSALRRVGREFMHLQGAIGKHKMVGFQFGALFERIPATVDVACRLSIDSWNNREQPQIILEDVRVPEAVSVGGREEEEISRVA